jgi:hypothetical protein
MKRYTKGDRVLHAQYGTGTLTDVNEYHTVIQFDEHGLRKFATNLVAFESTQIPAPERPAKAERKSKGTARSRS